MTTSPVNWTKTKTCAMTKGKDAFTATLANAPADLTDEQLQHDLLVLEQTYARAKDLAKRHRASASSQVIAAMTAWAKKAATDLLRQKVAGHPTPTNSQSVFEADLEDEIEATIAEIELAWQEADEQALVQRRTEAERAFGAAQPIMSGYQQAYERVTRAWEQSVQDRLQEGHDVLAARQDLLLERERYLLAHEQTLAQQRSEYLGYVRDIHALNRQDSRTSLANDITRGVKSTLVALFWLLVVVVLIVLVVIGGSYLVGPHAHP